MSSKRPIIGTIFSSDSSDDDRPPRRAPPRPKTDLSSSDQSKKVRLKVNMTSGGETKRSALQERQPPPMQHEAPEGFRPIDKTRIGTIKHNTMIQYLKNDGKLIKTKYFKKVDSIAGSIIVGFYLHNKRNYAETLKNIKELYVPDSATGGEDALKETIEVPQDQWKSLRRDMIISYEKDNNEYMYKVKFNSFVKGTDGSSRMSMTTERGFSYTANPQKIIKIFRHITSSDKTTTLILETLRKLEFRVRQLEQRHRKK